MFSIANNSITLVDNYSKILMSNSYYFSVAETYSHPLPTKPSIAPTIVTPTTDSMHARYQKTGFFSDNDFNSRTIPDSLKTILSRTANLSLAAGTWSSYKTGLHMLELCQTETGLTITFPLTNDQVLTFVGWLLQRNLSSDTINSYLSALRQRYIQLGLDPSSIRSDMVKQLLKGRNHQILTEPSVGTTKTRLPATTPVLKLMKQDLKTNAFEKEKKLLIWSVITVAFNGATWIHEILAKNHAKFSPLDTLLGKDITLKETTINSATVSYLQLTLKQEKTNSTRTPTVIDIFETAGPICPVSAYRKWRTVHKLQNDNLPAFRAADGRAFTGRDLNAYLSSFTLKYFPEENGKFTAHSLRIGLATTLGQLGLTDSEIQASGRWSSRVFEDYLRLPRTQRATVARKIGNISA